MYVISVLARAYCLGFTHFPYFCQLDKLLTFTIQLVVAH